MKLTNALLHPTTSLAQGICYLAGQSTPVRILAALISVTVFPIFLVIEYVACLIKLVYCSCSKGLSESQMQQEFASLTEIDSPFKQVFYPPIQPAHSPIPKQPSEQPHPNTLTFMANFRKALSSDLLPSFDQDRTPEELSSLIKLQKNSSS